LGPPPETAAYSMTFNRVDAFNRPVHLLILAALAPHCWLVCTLLICSLPFLWLLGLVPPVVALAHYSLAQVNTILLGGTGSCSVRSLLLTVVASLASVGAFHLYLEPASSPLVLGTTLVTFMLSQRWTGNWRQLRGAFFL